MISYGRQSISEEDIASVVEVLKSDWLTQGPCVTEFENQISKFVGCAYASAVSSGTAALHLACLALDLSDKDILWTSSISFVASANCGAYCGAKIDFVDVDRASGNICLEALSRKLEVAEIEGTLPKVLIVIHYAGNPCRLEEIQFLSKRYGFRVIEDACHALGASYKGTMIGSCSYSDISVFSFHPVKSITSGEGGMVTCNDEHLSRRIKLLSSHGITRDSECELKKPWEYTQIDLGFNYRMSDIHAALGLSQSKRINEFVRERRRLASKYDELINREVAMPITTNPEGDSAFHLYVLDVGRDKQLAYYNKLLENGYRLQVHYIPIHSQPFYKERLNVDELALTNSLRFYESVLSLPIYFGLEDKHIDQVSNLINEGL